MQQVNGLADLRKTRLRDLSPGQLEQEVLQGKTVRSISGAILLP